MTGEPQELTDRAVIALRLLSMDTPVTTMHITQTMRRPYAKVLRGMQALEQMGAVTRIGVSALTGPSWCITARGLKMLNTKTAVQT